MKKSWKLSYLVTCLVCLFALEGRVVQADNDSVYVVTRGEVWDWGDIVGKSKHYKGNEGAGLGSFVRSVNGFNDRKKLPFGKPVAMPPLEQLVANAKFPESLRPHAHILSDARKLVIRLSKGACRGSWTAPSAGDKAEMRRIETALESTSVALSKEAPGASKHARRAKELIADLRKRRNSAWFCKFGLGVLNRTGWALAGLHQHATRNANPPQDPRHSQLSPP